MMPRVLSWILVFVVTFFIMEFNAWALHKYVMHGFLWVLHKDHHQPIEGRRFQLNDAFAIVFAIPSFLFILFDSLYHLPLMGACGFGIMAYGVVYFFVHEDIIHRRWKIVSVKRGFYLRALNSAHKIHHSVKERDGAVNFGMLIVSWRYFSESLDH